MSNRAEVSQTTLTSKEIKQLKKLTKQWTDTKVELQALQAKELDLRSKVNSLLAKRDMLSVSAVNAEGTATLTFKRNKNYSITKASCVSIKQTIDNDVTFEKLFTVSYKLKTAAYELLEVKSKVKKVIDQHLVIKEAPLSVTSKDIE